MKRLPILDREDIDFFSERARIKAMSSKVFTPPEKWNLIRKAYKHSLPLIMSKHEKGGRSCPYILDWHYLFSPLEEMVWTDIRAIGIPFYPQVPVGNIFIDFADPYKKIGIEADGKAYHNPEKDKIRDQKLSSIGWKIYRIPYAYTYRMKDDFIEIGDTEEDSPEQWKKYKSFSSEGIIRSIYEDHYRRNYEYIWEELYG